MSCFLLELPKPTKHLRLLAEKKEIKAFYVWHQNSFLSKKLVQGVSHVSKYNFTIFLGTFLWKDKMWYTLFRKAIPIKKIRLNVNLFILNGPSTVELLLYLDGWQSRPKVRPLRPFFCDSRLLPWLAFSSPYWFNIVRSTSTRICGWSPTKGKRDEREYKKHKK